MPNFIERFENVKEHVFYFEAAIKGFIHDFW